MDDASMTHAEIGTLESIDFDNERIVTATATDGETVFRTFETTTTTGVRGLGDVMEVSEISSNMYGRLVVVEFTTEDGKATAQRLQFPDATEIEVTRGLVSSIDEESNMLTLAYAPGPDKIDLAFGYGATIDSPEGLLDLDELELGQEVTVYYDATRDVGIAYLLYQTG